MAEQESRNKTEQLLNEVIRKLLGIVTLLLGVITVLIVVIINYDSVRKWLSESTPLVAKSTALPGTPAAKAVEQYWIAPDVASITNDQQRKEVEYGKDLIAHTAKYLGPKGSVMQISNGLNCQNCHLQAGTAVFGNNYGSVASLYPKFRARSGSIETLYKRVNDCLERSLNGKGLDTNSREMQAISSYISFLGSTVKKGEKAKGSGLKDLTYLDRPADPEKGKSVYILKCQLCHQADGQGTFISDGTEYTYPPLWGNHSYNDAAGLYRISNFAKYVKYNMPQGTSHENPQLTDEEAWDVAAFVNSQPRPHKNTPYDWPDKSKKPVDHPFGPYADKFSEKQHKFGPYGPIAKEQKKREEATKVVASSVKNKS